MVVRIVILTMLHPHISDMHVDVIANCNLLTSILLSFASQARGKTSLGKREKAQRIPPDGHGALCDGSKRDWVLP
jgi:hypothetical protein